MAIRAVMIEKEVNNMDEFIKDIIDCFNNSTPRHADTIDDVLNELEKALEDTEDKSI